MIKQRLLVLTVFLTTLLSASGLYAAKFYKWVDEKGTTHYGANPPDTDTAVQINVKTGASSDQDKAIENLETQRKVAQEAREKSNNPDPQAEAEARNKEIMKRNCEIQKQNLGQLQANRRVKETNEQGEVRFLSEEEINNRIKEVQKYISENCQNN